MRNALILITGATDGIRLETARNLSKLGHEVIVHGRNQTKLQAVNEELGVETLQADFSNLEEVRQLAVEFSHRHNHLDVLINNAGVYKTSQPIAANGLDVRFVVNTIAPYILTQKLLTYMNSNGRVINLSSAAQAPVDMEAFKTNRELEDFEAYAQSKLAITLWTKQLASDLGENGPAIIAVNPGSLLGTKMVREGFGTQGSDISIGVEILCKLALNPEHSSDSGKYWDNDAKRFSAPAADSQDQEKLVSLTKALDAFNH